mmetsp:Transcript_37842/g.88057  ORF Transcript_37842/g.88057 Transcript_37842/m.88057 type:complete len:174 (-) Transcript_37842:257-778(-)|eukprot:CAMPEP_0114116582 /NCGR_PEP_ID=MMETSP0043_2-20121206/4573_1 /TAXON_ID=464988 /ORGANISM="Hemiselmis andersenii, Strain CCMP644" /LENGTH=173 /DNA_ID=CAMNT_0001208909 /DNA_START=64 /DNA_END=585 /DNA_ORIENTATION=+
MVRYTALKMLFLATSLLSAVDAFMSPAMPMRLARGKGSVCSLRAAEIKYGELQHCGVLVDDVKTGVDFYTKVLGMKDVSELRPNLPYEGAFLECGANQIHLMKLPDPDPRDGRPEHGGRDRHLAVTVGDLHPLEGSLKENGVAYTMSKSGRRALFCRDPYMNAIEFVEDASVA